MPTFPEGQDPLDATYGPSLALPTPPAPERPEPTITELSTAVTEQSVIGATARWLTKATPSSQPVEGYDPVPRIAGTKYDPYLSQFLGDVNPDQTNARMLEIDHQEHNRDVLARGGVQGTAGSLALGLTEPWWWFIPGGELAVAGRAARGATIAARTVDAFHPAITGAEMLGRMGVTGRAGVAAAGAAIATVPEQAILQSVDPTHTWAESAGAVASNALLAGVLGAAHGFLSPGEASRGSRALEVSRRDFAAGPGAEPPHPTSLAEPRLEVPASAPRPAPADFNAAGEAHTPVTISGQERSVRWRLDPDTGAVEPTHVDGKPIGEPAPVPAAAPGEPAPAPRPAAGMVGGLSAATADVRTMELEPLHAFGLRNLIGTFGPQAEQWFDRATIKNGWMSPVARMFASDRSLPGKQAAGDLIDTGLHFKQERAGVTPARGGLSAEVQSRALHDHYTGLSNGILQNQFAKHRGIEPGVTARARAYAEDMRGAAKDKLSFGDFKTEVSKALLDGGQHAMPEVAETAQMLNKHVFEPIKTMLQGIKDANGEPILGELAKAPKGDQGFLPRFYLKKAMAGNPQKFDDIVSSWLEQEQGKKIAAQRRLGSLNDSLNWLNDRMRSLESRIAGRKTALAEVQNRAEEVSRLNQFAYKRSATLSQPIDDLRQKVRGIQAEIQPHLDKLEQIAEGIKGERADLPQIREADAALFRMIGANQRLKEAGDIVGTVEAAHEFQDEIKRVVDGFRGGIADVRAQAKGMRNLPEASTLKALENARTAVRKEIAPYVKALNGARKQIAKLEEQRVPGARGGAVFETEIRNRGNILADRATGKQDQLNRLTEEHGRRQVELENVRKSIEEEIGNWEGKSSAEAKAALKAREKYEAERSGKIGAGAFEGEPKRLTSADSAVDRSVKRILEDWKEISPQEISDRARQIRNRIDTDPEGRLPYDEPKADGNGGYASTSDDFRGSLNARAFAIPTKDMLPFVNTDLEHVIPAYLRNVIPDALLTDRFGDIRMTEPLKKIDEWYGKKIEAAKTPEEAAGLEAERKREKGDIAAMRDRYRGVYGMPTGEFNRNLGRGARAFGQLNAITMLGSSVLNRLQDTVNGVSRRGMLGYMRDGVVPMIRGLHDVARGIDSGDAQLAGMIKSMGIGVDTELNHIASNFGDIINDHMPGNRFERTLQAASRGAMVINLHGPWTDVWRRVAAMAAMFDHLGSAERVAKGTASERDVRMLAYSGIDQPMAERIWNEFEAHHTEINGRMIPNTADWDENVESAFTNALRKEASLAVAMPGQEKPLWMSTPLGAAVGQFRSFEFAAWHRITMSNLQMSDANALQGMLSMVGAGMLSYFLYSVASGRKLSENPQDWVKEAIIRSGIMGPLSTMNTLQAKLTAGKTDLFRAIGAGRAPSRRDQTNVIEDALGPTLKELMGLGMTIPHIFNGTLSAHDLNNARQTFIPLQNLMFFRQLLDMAEDGLARHMGVKPLNRNPTQYPGMWSHPQ